MTNYRQILTEDKISRNLLVKQLEQTRAEIVGFRQRERELMEARDTVVCVQQATQTTIKDFIEEIVTLALKSTMGEAYSFKVVYEIKRNRSEAILTVLKNGEEYSPADDMGGTVCDIASVGLRIALFALVDPRPESVLLLDEPGKAISKGAYIHKFGEMLKEVSDMLKIQVIMVSHSVELIDTADRAFRVTQHNGVSLVEVV